MFKYLVSPYTHQLATVRAKQHALAESAFVWLMRQRIWVYSPIVHCHAAAQVHEMPTDFDFWQEYNKALIQSSHGVIVLTIDGWKESKGVNGEIRFAAERGLPIEYLQYLGGGKFGWDLESHANNPN